MSQKNIQMKTTIRIRKAHAQPTPVQHMSTRRHAHEAVVIQRTHAMAGLDNSKGSDLDQVQ